MTGEPLRIGDLDIDVQARRILRSGREVRLTKTEWGLLEEFVAHANMVLTTRSLLERVWGAGYSDAIDLLRAHVKNLRRKIEEDSTKPQIIVTESGGYRCVIPQIERFPSSKAHFCQVLPVPLTLFIGREREISFICHMLQQSTVRLLTLTGSGGIGKTRLAVQVAAELRDIFTPVFVPLAHLTDHRQVLSMIMQVFGIADDGKQSTEAQLIAGLAEQSLLLVLDNFEQVVEAAPQLTVLLTNLPHLKILLTSRLVLQVYGEHTFVVPPFAVPDSKHTFEVITENPAVELFVTRTRAIQPTFTLTEENAATIAAICVRLEGIPLAIELAAARSRLFSPQALFAQLEQRLAMLQTDMRDLPERQRTLRSAIDWSYQLLEPAEQRLLAQLTVFAGGWTLEAMDVVCGGKIDSLERLLNHSLVLRVDDTSNRFTMLEIVCEFALERLVERGELACMYQRHTAYYLQLAERAAPELSGSQQQQWLEQLEQEHPNLRMALRQVIADKNTEDALCFGATLWRFWMYRGHLREGRRWLEEILSLAGHKFHPSPTLAKVLNGAAGLAWMQGNYGQAQELLERSLELWRKLRDQSGIASTLANLGNVIIDYRSDYEFGSKLLQESLTIFQELNNRNECARIANNLGIVMQAKGDFEFAQDLYEVALKDSQDTQDYYATSTILMNMSLISMKHRKNFEEAEDLLKRSLKILYNIGEKSQITTALEQISEIYIQQDQFADAVKLASIATAMRENISAQRDVEGKKRFEFIINQSRQQLSETAFSSLWSEGLTMTLEQVLQEVLGVVI